MWRGIDNTKVWFFRFITVVLLWRWIGKEFRVLSKSEGGGERFELLGVIWIGGTWAHVKIREIILYRSYLFY